MPLFRPRQQKKGVRGVALSPEDLDEASLRESLPAVTHHFASLAQKTAIRFYRKIHSHETGMFLHVRDEFLFLLCHYFRQRLASGHPKDDASRLWSSFQEQLNGVLSELQQGFDGTTFWEKEAQRASRYERCMQPAQERGVALSGPAVASLFAAYQTLHLGPDLAAKISHFSTQVLRELETEL
jgi:hypothetical protein